MIAFGASGATPKHRMAQIAAGLGMLPGVIVDQHFQQRNRLGRLLSLIAQNPSLLGLGVDEDTAGVVGPDDVMEVIGRGSITVVDGSASETDAWEIQGHKPLMISGVVLHSLPAGYRFDLRRRQRLATPDAPRDPGRRRSRLVVTRSPGATVATAPRATGTLGTGASRARNERQEGSRGAGGTETSARRRQRRRPAAHAAARRDSPADRGPAPTLRILETRILRGPNYWAREPVVRMLVDLGVLEEYPSQQDPGLHRRPAQPAAEPRGPRLLASAGAAASSPGSRRARGPATSPSTSRSSSRTSPAPTSATARPAAPASTASYNVIYEFREEAVGIEAGKIAVALVNHLVAPTDPDHQLDFMAELERLIRLAERQAFGPSTQAILDEAASRDIPYIRLDRHSLVQLGQGVHQQRIRATMTVADVGHRRRHRERQEPDEPPPRLGRPAGPEERRRRRPRTRPPTPRTGSATRASSSRSTATTAAASTSTSAAEEAVRAAFHARPRREPRAATSSSRATSPATTTAAS